MHARTATPTQRPSAASVPFRAWTQGRTVSTLGTNAGAPPLPFQSWLRFKEAFAPELVERALTETHGAVRHILDPFGGSGTTALAAQFLGVMPTTIEVNPFLADLIEAKLSPIDCDTTPALLRTIVERVNDTHGPEDPLFEGAPPTFIEPGLKGRYLFSRAVARRFLAYRAHIEQISDIAHRRLFRIALASTAIPASNVVVSGKGRRYRRRWQERPQPPEIVDSLFKTAVLRALYDLRRFTARQCLDYRVLCGDARHLVDNAGPFDLAVFSPPYPNSFDYTDVYNVELWTMGYITNRQSNAALRRSTLRSHVQLLTNFEGAVVHSQALKLTVEALRDARSQLWNPHIPEMIGGYANDLSMVLTKLSAGLRPLGRVYMIVAGSRYAGVEVPVATIIEDISHRIGYTLVVAEPCRSMRSSPQQGGRPDLQETLIVLQKP